MVESVRQRVVVLYAHALLGQGLASLLSAEDGIDAIAVASNDRAARKAALDQRPALVIVEETDEARPFETAGSLPVVFIRVDAQHGGRLGQPLNDPEDIVALARQLISRSALEPSRST